MKDDDQPATRGDLRQLSEAFDRKLEAHSKSLTETFDVKLAALSNDINDKYKDMKASFQDAVDQIVRGFQMTEENIRGHAAHVDEVADLEQRVTRVEQKLGIERGVS